jgi:hypothetical protein
MLAVVALVLSTGVSAFDAAERGWRWSRQAFTAGMDAWRERRTTAERPRPTARAARDVATCRCGYCSKTWSSPSLRAKWRLPPIIREPEKPEKKPPVARRERGKRLEGQEELFVNDRYRLPTVSLLDEPKRREEPLDEAALHASSRILETKLGDFGVAGRVVAVRPGPVITTFEFEPAPGREGEPHRRPRRRPRHGAARGRRCASWRRFPASRWSASSVEPAPRDRLHPRADRGRGVPRADSHLALALGKDTTATRSRPTWAACRIC